MAIVGLISCVSRKRNFAAQAQDLYDSALFAKAKDYVQAHSDRWFILSAKYGLVSPDQVIEPYEETLNTKTRAEREQWASNVWVQLSANLRNGDRVIILAGERYREFLVPKIIAMGCTVDVPMEGLGIGRQLQWLSQRSANPHREFELERLYKILSKLETGLNGRRLMSECSGQHSWPRSGVYLFYEPGEFRLGSSEPRVVRVGTHGVSQGSKSTLWTRLRTHRGAANGLGNHRGSIFRLHVGAALIAREPGLAVPSWGRSQVADSEIRKQEEHLERAVSQHIGSMGVLWLSVQDEAGPASDRAYLERNLIGLLVGQSAPADMPSSQWLGLFSPDERIRQSGLWNLDFLNYSYSSEFLEVLDEYVSVTIGCIPQPQESIAPRDWYRNAKKNASRNS